MIAGLSGTILSHDAVHAAGLIGPPGDEASRVQKELARWHAALSRVAGPTWSARKVFDEVAAPLCASLGLHPIVSQSDSAVVRGVLQVSGATVGVVEVVAWGQDLFEPWRRAVLNGLAAGVRWSFCVNGRALRLYDATRTHSRRFVELELEQIAHDPETFALAWRLLGGGAFASARATALDAAVLASERHRAGVRDSLQAGVQDAIARFTSAFIAAARKDRSRRAAPLRNEQAYEESLVVIYRILFLLFAEARGLVPNWHPVFRDSYTVEALRPVVESSGPARGVWETLQAIARLAHRGCRAGTLRVPPFNGRLFSPSHAPLAESLPLDDRVVRDALLALTTRQEADRRRRIAYTDLGVEHLGGVYERVLDFEISPSGTPGPAMLVRGGRRKSTGSFYTPRGVTEYLIRRTLFPLVDRADPDGILRLRIVDPAMGSGAFLVAACRYLAHAYESALIRHGVVASGDVTDEERSAFRRVIAQRCLYGVDVNPTAVQLARLSLWLATLCRDRPLTFFDHHLRAGNSLAGASMRDLLRHTGAKQKLCPMPLFSGGEFDQAVGAAVVSLGRLRDGAEDTLEDVRSKERLFATLSSPAGPLARWKHAADLWCAGWFAPDIRGITRGTIQAIVAGDTLPQHVEARLLELGRDVVERERFFHWTFQFPEVFCDESGGPRADAGFDAVVGNPPWEMLRADGRSRPGGKVEDRTRLTRFARDSGVYLLQGRGHPNLYQMFLERALSLARTGGRLGLVLPSGLAADHGSALLRRHLFDSAEVDSLVSVENRERIFPVHRSLRFLLMTATNGSPTQVLPLRSGLTSAAQFDTLPETMRDPEAVPLSRELLVRFSGSQLAVPDLRSRRDAAIAARLVFAHPAIGDPEGWDLRFGRELNATDDKQHFGARTEHTLAIVEGKQIQPFHCDASASRNFISETTVTSLLPDLPFGRARLAYRDVAGPTNRWTLIAAVLPPAVVTTHTLFCLKTPLDEDAQHFLCAMFNSFVANYLVRMRVTTHVTTIVIDRLPVPRVARDSSAFHEMAALGRALATEPSNLQAAARHQALAAFIYGVTPEEFAHILTTFPLVDGAHRAAAMDAFVRTL